MVSYELCYLKDGYEMLRHQLSLYTQGDLERKCRIEGSDRIPFVAT
ncbi:MAG: hypothetical protein ACTMUB_06520 [cyanobacterium endosymbiont of Rhopalodia musculus]